MLFKLRYKSFLTIDGQLFSAEQDEVTEGILDRLPHSALYQALLDRSLDQVELPSDDEFSHYIVFAKACSWLLTTDLPYGMVWAVQFPETAPETFGPSFNLDDHANDKVRRADQLLPKFAVYAEIGRALGLWPVVHNAATDGIDRYWLVIYKEEPSF